MSQHDDSHSLEPARTGRLGSPVPAEGEIQGPPPRHDGLPIPGAPRIDHDGWRSAGTGGDYEETRRFTLHVPPAIKVAAVIALASAFGALAGSLAASRVTTPATDTPTAMIAKADDGSLEATVARLQQDMTGLKTSLESSAEALRTQTTRLTERLDRAERAQAEPTQKLADLGKAIERLERRTAQLATPTQTASAAAAAAAPAQAAASGSAASQPATPAPATTASVPVPPPAPAHTRTTQVASADIGPGVADPRYVPEYRGAPVLPGWAVREVRRGIAVIEGRYGLIEVEPGDRLPGLGRIESIQRQDGRWVVATSRGLIVQR